MWTPNEMANAKPQRRAHLARPLEALVSTFC